VAFAPDGKTVVTSSADRTARLWDVATGKESRVFTGHTDTVLSVTFATDGRTVVTGSVDNTVRLWDTDYRAFIGFACTRVYRDFTEDERYRFEIFDPEPTCPQFGQQLTPMPPTTTPISNLTLPVWTPIASPTITATYTPSITPTPTVTLTYPGVLLTFTPTAPPAP
jgi:WD40 repeat protein